MITKELVAQWAKEAHVLDINQALHRFANLAAAHGAAQRDAELLGVVVEPVAYHYSYTNAFGHIVWNIRFCVPPEAIEVRQLYTATQLAAAPLQGAADEQEKNEAAWAIYDKRIDDVEAAHKVWLDKTEWVQSNDLPAKYLGWHRADVLKDMIAAARLQGAGEMDAQLMEQNTALGDECARLERVNQRLIIALKSCWDLGIDSALVPQVRAAIAAAEKEEV